MKRQFHDTLRILTAKEKKQFFQQAGWDAIINILDIAFLSLLLLIIHYYTHPQLGTSDTLIFFRDKNPNLLILLFVISYSAKNILGLYIRKKQYELIYSAASRISEEHLSAYFISDYAQYANTDSSVHVRKISQQPIEFAHYVLQGFQQIISQLVIILLTITAIILYSPSLFFTLSLILLPPVMLTGYLLKKNLSAVRLQVKHTSEKALQHLNEALKGFIEGRIYNKSRFFVRRYALQQQKLNRSLGRLLVAQNAPSRVIEIFMIAGLFLLIVLDRSSFGRSTSFVTIGAFMAAAYKIIPGMVKILNSIGHIRAYEFTIGDLSVKPVPVSAPARSDDSKIDSIAFKDVSFSYERKTILKDFNIEMNRGDMIGISGLSGKGKTTMINLLLGFLEPSGGEISINQRSTSTADRQQYWSRISYVKQEPFLINGSIDQNVLLDEDGYDGKKYEKISRIADLHIKSADSLLTPPDTINENGKNISGGQRQRIAFARALYKDFDLIVLDEPFSELDSPSEISMLMHLRELSRVNKIVLLITHNQHSLSFCNKTFLMNGS